MKVKIPEFKIPEFKLPSLENVAGILVRIFNATPNMFYVFYSFAIWIAKISPILLALYLWSNWGDIMDNVREKQVQVEQKYEGVELSDYAKDMLERLENR